MQGLWLSGDELETNLVNTTESVLPVCKILITLNKRKVQNGYEILVLWKYAFYFILMVDFCSFCLGINKHHYIPLSVSDVACVSSCPRYWAVSEMSSPMIFRRLSTHVKNRPFRICILGQNGVGKSGKPFVLFCFGSRTSCAYGRLIHTYVVKQQFRNASFC